MKVNPVALMQFIAGSAEPKNLTLILRVMWPFLCLMKSEALKWLHLMTLSNTSELSSHDCWDWIK